MSVLKDLQPENLFRFFEEISQIPRGSKEEKAVSDYLVKFAKGRGLQYTQDAALNVMITKPASPGYENAPATILQSHMDMVNEKNAGTTHDFTKDPLKLYIDGDFIHAKDTTLGADNGIGLSMSLAILDGNYAHGQITAMITVDEEAGMGGAKAIDPAPFANYSYMINLDTAEEGYLTTSCAGNSRNIVTMPITYTSVPAGFVPYEIDVTGLFGGHSGGDIHLGLANSNRLLSRVLDKIFTKETLADGSVVLASVSGGLKENAIPREAKAVIAVSATSKDKVLSIITEMEKGFKQEYREWEPNLSLAIKEANPVANCFDTTSTKNAITILNLLPLGLVSANKKSETQTSNNIGVVTTDDKNLTVYCMVRSSLPTQKLFIRRQIEIVASIAGATAIETNANAAWEYNPDSKLRDVCTSVYKNMYNKEQVVTGTHGGLECGILYEKMPHLDIVSFGPDNHNLHTPEEHASISSTKRVYDYLVEVLKEIK